MLNEDELRDAILLVFANKQDLPVSSLKSHNALLFSHPLTLYFQERHERRRDHRQAWPPQLETTCLGMFLPSPNLNEALPARICHPLSLIANAPQQYIQSTCATSGDGLYEGLEWLATTLRKAGHQ